MTTATVKMVLALARDVEMDNAQAVHAFFASRPSLEALRIVDTVLQIQQPRGSLALASDLAMCNVAGETCVLATACGLQHDEQGRVVAVGPCKPNALKALLAGGATRGRSLLLHETWGNLLVDDGVLEVYVCRHAAALAADASVQEHLPVAAAGGSAAHFDAAAVATVLRLEHGVYRHEVVEFACSRRRVPLLLIAMRSGAQAVQLMLQAYGPGAQRMNPNVACPDAGAWCVPLVSPLTLLVREEARRQQPQRPQSLFVDSVMYGDAGAEHAEAVARVLLACPSTDLLHVCELGGTHALDAVLAVFEQAAEAEGQFESPTATDPVAQLVAQHLLSKAHTLGPLREADRQKLHRLAQLRAIIERQPMDACLLNGAASTAP